MTQSKSGFKDNMSHSVMKHSEDDTADKSF